MSSTGYVTGRAMLTYKSDAIGRDYPDILNMVRNEGDESAPRGQKIKEVRPLVLHTRAPDLCVIKRSGFNRALMWVEIAHLLAGKFDLDLVKMIAPTAAPLMSDQGAYGPRVADQLRYVVKELMHDPDSRRAVVYVGDQKDLRYSEHYEQPCTMTWQFFLRDDQLEMIVNMRSWDLVWGLAYDLPCFVSVQMALAEAFGAKLGSYTHVAGSGHVYERHWGLAVEASDEELPSVAAHDPYSLKEDPLYRWDTTVSMAEAALSSIVAGELGEGEAPSPQWEPAFAAWRARLSG